jgi:CheY-like chemotaxis protein
MTKPQILLVDDSNIVRMVIAMQLEKLGLDVDLAGDGQEAVHAARSKRYDMVLMDIMMPKMDGIEATKQIRQLEQEQGFSKTIIIGVTGYVNRAECIAAGMDDFMFKPVTINQLKTIIMQWKPDWEVSNKPTSAHLFADDKAVPQPGDLTDERISDLKKRLGYDTTGGD